MKRFSLLIVLIMMAGCRPEAMETIPAAIQSVERACESLGGTKLIYVEGFDPHRRIYLTSAQCADGTMVSTKTKI